MPASLFIRRVKVWPTSASTYVSSLYRAFFSQVKGTGQPRVLKQGVTRRSLGAAFDTRDKSNVFKDKRLGPDMVHEG
ncbi:hypothetical protein KXD40_009274 [Peronospora effusa]|nr:hypothetical protein KXD40_009274 [Peronospora effusa]